MKSIFKKFASLSALCIAFTTFADDYVAIGKQGKVYDDPSPKYVTMNQNNEELNVMPGMAFKTTEHPTGWYLIEYSPGLHAYIPEQIVASNIQTPQPGSYTVKNHPGENVNIEQNGSEWTATSGDKSYKGVENNGIVIFTDNSGNPAFSLVNIGSGGTVINYDNKITNFF